MCCGVFLSVSECYGVLWSVMQYRHSGLTSYFFTIFYRMFTIV